MDAVIVAPEVEDLSQMMDVIMYKREVEDILPEVITQTIEGITVEGEEEEEWEEEDMELRTETALHHMHQKTLQ